MIGINRLPVVAFACCEAESIFCFLCMRCGRSLWNIVCNRIAAHQRFYCIWRIGQRVYPLCIVRMFCSLSWSLFFVYGFAVVFLTD